MTRRRLAIAGAVVLLAAAQIAAQQHGGSHQWDGHSAAEFIAREEGIVLHPYHDAAGFPTICVGHLLSDTKHADLAQWQPMSRAECLDLLDQDLDRFRRAVDLAVLIALTADQETALVSLAFNIGSGAFQRSELVRLLDAGAPEHQVVLEWLDWSHAGGKLSDGLVARRRREVALFYGD